jgi:hypothetical protein
MEKGRPTQLKIGHSIFFTMTNSPPPLSGITSANQRPYKPIRMPLVRFSHPDLYPALSASGWHLWRSWRR